MAAAPVRQSHITRVVKAMLAAGVSVGSVEVTPEGGVKVVAIGEAKDSDEEALNEWVKNNAGTN